MERREQKKNLSKIAEEEEEGENETDKSSVCAYFFLKTVAEHERQQSQINCDQKKIFK